MFEVIEAYSDQFEMTQRSQYLKECLHEAHVLRSPGAKYRPTEAKANLLMPDKGEPSKHVNIPGLDQGQT
jgi:hypothetical protein